jgi:LacI family transcriptional regulator, galactose operon repressor
MTKRTIRLKDIAAATGFSANTVSLALRGSDRLPEQTRERILAAARRLNYLPNQVAQSLVSRQTKTIGLILTSILNPILTQAARSIEREVAARGYSLMLSATENDLAKEVDALNVFRSRQVDGMLIYAANHSNLDHIRPLREAGYPIVLLVAQSDAAIDVVSVDDRRGAEIAADHLVALGHRRVGFIDAASSLGNREKYDGYTSALRRGGIDLDPALIVDPRGHGATEGYRVLDELMRARPRPTALFASNDLLAIGALRWCRDHGVRVPDDLAIVGHDDIQAADFVAVPLTTVRYDAGEVSRLAVRRLLALISAADHLPAPDVTLIEPELVVRRSCGAALGPKQGRLAVAAEPDPG